MATDALEPDVVATYAVDADSVEPAAVEAEPVAVMDDVSTLVAATPLPVVMPQPTADELVAIAEQAEAVGNHIEARRLLVNAAREFAREGRYEAGLDVAHQLLHEYPSDVDVHLVLVELYISRNWETVAAEKLILLGRLADLDDDEETRLRLCAAASQAFPENGRLASLCA